MKNLLLIALLAFGGTSLAGGDSKKGVNAADLYCADVCAFHEDAGNYTFILIKNATNVYKTCIVRVPATGMDHTAYLSPKTLSGLLRLKKDVDWVWDCTDTKPGA